MKVLVVGEDKRIIRKLDRVLKGMNDTLRIIGTVPSMFTSAGWLQQHGIPDIILVSSDVIQKQELVPQLLPDVQATIIFTVQSDQFTFQAFRLQDLEHLLPEPLTQRADEAEKGEIIGEETELTNGLLTVAPPVKKARYRNRFLVKQGQKFASVETPLIACFFSEGRFIFFKTFDNQKYLVEYTLEELESMLNPHDFFRINRSLLISFKSVSQIHPYFGNRLKLYLDPPMEKEIIVSREKVNDFKLWLGQ